MKKDLFDPELFDYDEFKDDDMRFDAPSAVEIVAFVFLVGLGVAGLFALAG